MPDETGSGGSRHPWKEVASRSFLGYVCPVLASDWTSMLLWGTARVDDPTLTVGTLPFSINLDFSSRRIRWWMQITAYKRYSG